MIKEIIQKITKLLNVKPEKHKNRQRKATNDLVNGNRELSEDFSEDLNANLGNSYFESREDFTNYPERESKSLNNAGVKTKQNRLMLLILGGVFLFLVIVIKLVGEKKREKEIIIEEKDAKVKVEVASNSLDGDKIWQNHFEDLLREKEMKLEERLKLSEENFIEREKRLLEENRVAMEKINQQLKYAQEELQGAALELRRASDMQEELKYQEQAEIKSQGNVTSNRLESEIEWDKPKSVKNYIPASHYVTGYTMDGISLSGALQEPTKLGHTITIHVIDRGNLSKKLELDVRTCLIQGSVIGTLNNERIEIRADQMICTDPKTDLVTTTDIVGEIRGDDGMNGIKGKVISVAEKHLKNALIGGFISGLANSAKGQDGLTLTSAGALNTKRKGFAQVAGDGVMTGVSNAAEKVGEYRLGLAQQLSPVIEMAGGIIVDVKFTAGVFIGQRGMRKKINELRKQNIQQSGQIYEDY